MIFPLKIRRLIRGFQAHINAGLGGGADYEADHKQLYAPCDGKVETYQGIQGGNWLRITRPNGDRIEFAHLSKYMNSATCKEGDIIAVTGNTGQLTTGPHLHVQVFVNNKRIDPVIYFMQKYKLLVVNPPDLSTFKQKTSEYAGLDLQIDTVLVDFNIDAGMPSYDFCKEILKNVDTSAYKGAILFYPTNPTATFEATHLWPERNLTFATVPLPTANTLLTHTFLHLVRKWMNFNKLTNIWQTEPEKYPTSYDPIAYNDFNNSGWAFQAQYDELRPYLPLLENTVNPIVKGDNSNDVYRLRDGVKDLFLNAYSFQKLDGRWGEIKVMPQAELDAVQKGDVLLAVPNE